MVATPSRTQSITPHMNKKTMQPNYRNRLKVLTITHGTSLETRIDANNSLDSRIDKDDDVVVMSEVPSHRKDMKEDY